MKMRSKIRCGALAALLGSTFLAGAADAAVVISSGQTTNMSCSAGVCAPTAVSAVLNVADLENYLSTGNIEVTTTGSGVQAGNIKIDAPLTWSNGSTLTLDAYDSIGVNRPISATGPGGLFVVTSDGGSSGTFSFGPKGNVTFPGTSNALTINGRSYTLVTSLPALIGEIATNVSGSYALAQNYDAEQDGKYRYAAIPTTFEGHLNGLGNTILHLSVGGSKQNQLYGLFGTLDSSSTVSSLRLAKMKVDAGSHSNAGGIAGFNYGTLFNSSVNGSLHAAHGAIGVYGGVVGSNFGTISDVLSDAAIDIGPGVSTEVYAGDLVGINNSGSIDDSFATGSITENSKWPQAYLGGLASVNTGTIENCYATGSVSAPNASGESVVGGLIAFNYVDVMSSYSTGAPTAAGSGDYVGGSIGVDLSDQNGGSIENTYWDTTTSGITNPGQGAGNIVDDPGITGDTSKQLQAKLPRGFDRSIWAENPKINNGLPYLIDNPPENK